MNFALLIAQIAFIAAVLYGLFVLFQRFLGPTSRKIREKYHLTRHSHNPILSPQAHRDWESEGTFNPAAVKDDEGRVHLFYRAIGRDGLSRIGHSSSRDGKHFDVRSQYPVYEPLPGYGMPHSVVELALSHSFDIVANPSGGGWGGSEDPRAVQIDDRVYMTYTAFNGWDDVRIGVTSIAASDMKKGRWNWRRPVLISPPKTVNKNWVFFPEKINGKFVLIHSVSPTISISYVDSPEMAPKIKSTSPRGGREDYWDNWMRGAGAPPIKTDKGWLLLYHAMDKNDPNKYKVGVMLLDLKDPTKILYRSPQPILTPDAHYENDGKPGVVYATGAVIKDGKLLVYYGGGDKHTCVAETPLEPLLAWLMKYGKV